MNYLSSAKMNLLHLAGCNKDGTSGARGSKIIRNT